jgi:hypothetical protein
MHDKTKIKDPQELVNILLSEMPFIYWVHLCLFGNITWAKKIFVLAICSRVVLASTCTEPAYL